MPMKVDDFDGLDREYVADAGQLEQQPMLPPHFGLEDPNRWATIAAQRDAIATWLSRNCLVALARREIRARRREAFAAEGFA
jgi:hypothetical protein